MSASSGLKENTKESFGFGTQASGRNADKTIGRLRKHLDKHLHERHVRLYRQMTKEIT